jgi:excisionase family DNA binding protein
MSTSSPRSQSENALWLDLSDAAQLLGVHFSTLRRWVDTGKVPCIRTPGGRRRFRRSELEAFLASLQQNQGSTLAPFADLHHSADISVRVGHLGVAHEPWYRKIGEEQRNAMRRGGQQLMAILMQYTTRINGGEAFLVQGRQLAAYYGEACRQSGLSMVETLQAFLSVRNSIFDSVYEAGTLAGMADADTWRLYDRMNEFLDSMLLATVEAYNAVAARALPSPIGE